MIQTRYAAAWLVFPMLAFGALAAPLAHAQSVAVYSAGSLRAVVAGLQRELASSYGIEVAPTFGGSGLLRERIEHGEQPELFMSADLGSPRKLASQNRTVLPIIPFARNRMCVISRRTAHVTQSNLIAQMLKPEVRLKTSTPIADPAGDYAWAIFDRIEASHPGKGDVLKAKAQKLMSLTAPAATASQSAAAALFAARQVDMSITYCSAVAALLKELPELASLPVPEQFDPHPVYGLAILSAKPEALRTALFVLSERGQALVAEAGLLPISDSAAAKPP